MLTVRGYARHIVTSAVPARPVTSVTWVTGHRRHFAAVLVGVLTVLAVVNLADAFGPAVTGLVVGPVAAVGLLSLARRSGLSWHDLGLSRRTWIRGAVVAIACSVAVAAVYVVGAALPATHAAFTDARYQLPLPLALYQALVVVPVSTVLVEEVAFRGVLLGLLTRRRGARWGLGVSSVLFGLWHVLPSLDLARANRAAGALAGGGVSGQVLVVVAVVAFTAGAGLLLGHLRRRSGSLLASAGLHWAVNGVGVLVTALLVAHR